MALLLAMYQKMRLIRERNQLTLDLTKYTSKVNRVEKNIQRVQKRYTSLFAQIDAQAKMMQSNAKNLFLSMSGLGASQVNPYDYSGMTAYVQSAMTAMLQKDVKQKDKDGNEVIRYNALSDDKINNMMAAYMSKGNSAFAQQVDEDGNPKFIGEGDDRQPDYGDYTKEEIEFFMAAKQQALSMQSNQQWQVQQMENAYSNNVSIWVDAQKAKLEEEQDAALEPLNYQQTMWELEKEQIEQRLTRIKSEIESYDQLTKDEAQRQAPKFGLG